MISASENNSVTGFEVHYKTFHLLVKFFIQSFFVVLLVVFNNKEHCTFFIYYINAYG